VSDPVENEVESRPVMAEIRLEIKRCLPDCFVFTKNSELGTFIPKRSYDAP
jgi:hypothetical protein